MTDNLLQPPRRGQTLEEVGCECFDGLVSRLFFKQVDNDDEKYFVMHDLMHDLATFLAGDLYCRFAEKEEMSILTRHLSYNHSIPETKWSSNKKESLRTLLYINYGAHFWKSRTTLPCDILSKNKYLRVLSFDTLDIFRYSIAKKLIQLRYLNLSWSAVKILPESLCNLCNLQTLKLEGCSKLTMLPNGMYNLVNLRHLNIRGTPLKKMPKGMGILKQLHILSKFVVGKQEDNGMEELGGLWNLHGSLEIEKLENVVDGNEARSARIIEKKHIEELLLKWSVSSGDDMVSNTHTDEQDILGGLQPHTGLKELIVYGYKGKIFPEWIGHSLYQNMTSVSLQYCWNCCVLPSLGQLPSLKSLSIKSFDKLKSIGKEFYKNEGHQRSSPIAPFPSLETLVFDGMSCWEEWHLPDSEAFPQLKSLLITKCPMLKGDMFNQVLMRIVFSSSDVSKVRLLEIGGDDKGLDKEMTLDENSLSIRGFESVVECAFKARIIHHLTSLQEIKFWECSSVVSLGSNCLPKSLQKLRIYSCSQIELLQQQHKYDLVHLQIESCDSLTSLSLDAFPNLENLKIERCSNLESVSMSEPPHAALQRLSIRWCDEFVSFPEAGLVAPNLAHLSITYCDKLEALPRDMNSLLPNLQSLDIRGCPIIHRLPEGGLPPNLKELSVGDWEEQVRGLSWLGNLDNLTHLTIAGFWCESIKSYPEAGWLPRLPSLTTLYIQFFDNLETLECSELLRLTSLQQLHISYCPRLKNMEGEKLPPSLFLLEIYHCGLLGKNCKNKHQQIWSKISHIPTIEVDGKKIF
ncbi:putative disease resistance protein At3g14460 [Arachis stenosperma]|uniref:putative disease resistance protein At3g14460 n=1 Tax=Arachis stenosperma TaxID=217475 RepID=UPI0025AD5050|nr:putative disease resistance protein At3g14460 [Arachis stenosperma]